MKDLAKLIGMWAIGYIIYMAPMAGYCAWRHPDHLGVLIECATVGYVVLLVIDFGQVLINGIRTKNKTKKEMEP